MIMCLYVGSCLKILIFCVLDSE